MPLGLEIKAVQEALIKYATEVGWEYVSTKEALRLRDGKKRIYLS